MSEPQVMLALPSTGTTKSRTAISLAELCKQSGPVIGDIVEVQSCYIHRSRGHMLERALGSDATHMLFVDADLIFPGDALTKLLEADKDIIGAAYNMRMLRDDGQKVTTVKPLPEDLRPDGSILIPEQPFQVRAVPTGLMLIRLDAVRDLERPFDFRTEPDGEFVGEDVWFCDRAREAGAEVWCDPRIQVGHIGDAVF